MAQRITELATIGIQHMSGIQTPSRQKTCPVELDYRDILESANDLIQSVAPDGSFLYVNRAWRKTLGYSRKEISGLSLFDIIHPDNQTHWREIFQRVLSGKKVNHIEATFVSKEGRKVYLEGSISCRFAKGKPVVTIGIFRDISEHVRVENLIRIQRDLYVALNSVISLDEALRLCLEAAISASKMDCGGIYLVDESSGDLHLMFAKNLSSDFLKTASHYDANSASARLIKAGKPIYTNHQKIVTSIESNRRDEGLQALAIIPVLYEGKVIGCLNIASHTLDEVPVFARNALEAIAAQIGSIISRIKTEETLRENEKKYYSLFKFHKEILEQSPVGILRLDENMHIVYENPEMKRLMGVPPNDEQSKALGKDIRKLPSIRKTGLVQELDNLLKGKKIQGEKSFTSMYGKKLYLSFIISPIMQGGRFLGANLLVTDITEHKRAEEALQKSEIRYRTLFDAANDAIFIMSKEKFIECNPKTLEMFGCKKKEDIVGHAPYEFSPPKQPDGKNSREAALEKIDAALAGIPQRFYWKHIKKDGTPFDTEVSLNRFEAGNQVFLQAIVRDISERKRTEEALRKSEEQYRGIFESATDAFLIFNLNGEIVEANPAACKMYGYSYKELIKLSGKDIVHSDYSHTFEDFIKQVTSGNKFHAESIDVRKDGSTFNVEIQGTLFNYQGKPHLLSVVRDISERKHLQEQLRQAQKMEAVGALAGGVAHDFNNTRLIGENISLCTDLESDIWTVEGDTANIEQVIMNLVVNARDAMPEGGQISIKTRNVTVDKKYCRTHSYARPGKFVSLSVQDTGIGMKEDIIDRIFEPFFSTKRAGQGTGLGLSVVYGIIKKHEGWIEVESSPGSGSTFKIYLPAVSWKPEKEKTKYVTSKRLKGHGERILVVEDDESVREFTTRGLSQNGYVVTTAKNAQEAIKVFQKNKANFNLVVSDVVLPDETGPRLAKRLRKLKPDIGILFTSGYSGEKSNWQTIQQNGYPYLQKPYLLTNLLKVINEVLKNKCNPELVRKGLKLKSS
ncbi:hypothetical protein B5M50_05240 [candidate division KSB1 bacterium 4484_219]|nr:MAG: hypothetical protein B5M50_05240 [candidate division KSB1 bacterium 4484_219]